MIRLFECCIGINDQVLRRLKRAGLPIGPFGCILFHSCFRRIGGASREVDATALNSQGNGHLDWCYTASGSDFDGSECDFVQHAGVSRKVGPLGPPRIPPAFSYGCRFNAVAFENAAKGAVANMVADVRTRTACKMVNPRWILITELQDQIAIS